MVRVPLLHEFLFWKAYFKYNRIEKGQIFAFCSVSHFVLFIGFNVIDTTY